ncbi:MAG: ABC transporter ATP-binding protein [Parasporobacterium sp.]|nr:ABC transporter ATP-binding protein [Parasporobacterium sp.]
MSKTILEVKNVSLDYQSKTGPIHAIENINFNIDEGEFICVLGPSGCGKSTLLKLIAGFEFATEGELLLEGEPIKGIDCHRGVVFQKDNLFEWFNVRNNVNYGLRMQGKLKKPEIDKKTDDMLSLMGLSEFADKKVYELSGGMRQRVSIGRTLINDPEILLMDEPFSALDALTREQLQDALRDLWMSQKNTIFFITHDIDEAMVLASRILVMSSRPGRIIRDLKLEYTYSIYENGNSRRKLSEQYFELRRELFELISGNQ